MTKSRADQESLSRAGSASSRGLPAVAGLPLARGRRLAGDPAHRRDSVRPGWERSCGDAPSRHQLLRDYVDVANLRDMVERHDVRNVTSLRWPSPCGAESLDRVPVLLSMLPCVHFVISALMGPYSSRMPATSAPLCRSPVAKLCPVPVGRERRPPAFWAALPSFLSGVRIRAAARRRPRLARLRPTGRSRRPRGAARSGGYGLRAGRSRPSWSGRPGRRRGPRCRRTACSSCPAGR